MIFLMNLLILLFVLYVLAKQIDYNNRLAFDKYRFEYFQLRDRMAMLVINGTLDENSWEYKNIINTINYHIHSIETVSIGRIAKMLMDYHTSVEERKKVQLLEKRIENNDVIEIIIDFMITTQKLLKRNSKAQLFLVRYFSNFSSIQRVSKPKQVIEEIQHHKDLFSHRLPKAA